MDSLLRSVTFGQIRSRLAAHANAGKYHAVRPVEEVIEDLIGKRRLAEGSGPTP